MQFLKLRVTCCASYLMHTLILGKLATAHTYGSLAIARDNVNRTRGIVAQECGATKKNWVSICTKQLQMDFEIARRTGLIEV